MFACCMAGVPDAKPLRRTFTVVGISGKTLMEAVEVSSLDELRELTATSMSTSACRRLGRITCLHKARTQTHPQDAVRMRLLSADGRPLTKIDEAPEGSTLTAVAISTSGLLLLDWTTYVPSLSPVSYIIYAFVRASMSRHVLASLREITGLVGDPVASVPQQELETMALKAEDDFFVCWRQVGMHR